jgi:AcrR family transcriptional regulator
VTALDSTPSARKSELLEASYRYVARHGLADLSLRPLASEVGSSPRVLLYLFGSKHGLIRALLARARDDQLSLLTGLPTEAATGQWRLGLVAERLWSWLVDHEHRGLLKVWLEAYALSLANPGGPWSGFARETVDDWLAVLRASQPVAVRDSAEGRAERTAVLALLRGALLDLLATGDVQRTTAAVQGQLGR